MALVTPTILSVEASAIVAVISGALAKWDPGTDGNAGGANDELEIRGCTVGSTGTPS